MSTLYDGSVGVAKETTYKTYAAPTRHYEWSDCTLDFTKNTKTAAGLRVGRRTDSVDRRYVPTAAGAGDLTLELATKGLGPLWSAAFGTATSTVYGVTTAYQQTFTFGDAPISLTIQTGVPHITTATGAVAAVDPYAYLGCMVTGFEIDTPVDDIATVKFSFDVGDIDKTTSLATVTLPTGMTQFHGAQLAAASFGGTLTLPAANTPALASMAGGTAVGLRNFNVKVDGPLAVDRFNAGGSGRKSKPAVSGLRKVTGSFTAEYDGTTWRDDYLADTTVPILLSFDNGVVAGTAHNEAFQIVIPAAKLDSGVPQPSKGDLVLVDYNYTAYETAAGASSLQIVQVTTDNETSL